MKQIATELDDFRMELVRKLLNVENHLGIDTTELPAEDAILSNAMTNSQK